jgi:hypothetical protein
MQDRTRTQAVHPEDMEWTEGITAALRMRYPYLPIPDEFIHQMIAAHKPHGFSKQLPRERRLDRFVDQVVLLYILQLHYTPAKRLVLAYNPYQHVTSAAKGILDFTEIAVISEQDKETESAFIRSLGYIIDEEGSWQRQVAPGVGMYVFEVKDSEGNSLNANRVIQEYAHHQPNTLVFGVLKDGKGDVRLQEGPQRLSRGLTPEDEAPVQAALSLAFAQGRVKEPDAKMQAALLQATQYLRGQGEGNLATLLEESEFRFVMPDADIRAHSPPHYLWYHSADKFLLATAYGHQGKKLALIPYALAELLLSQNATGLLARIFTHEAKHIHIGFASPEEHEREVREITGEVEEILVENSTKARIDIIKSLDIRPHSFYSDLRAPQPISAEEIVRFRSAIRFVKEHQQLRSTVNRRDKYHLELGDTVYDAEDLLPPRILYCLGDRGIINAPFTVSFIGTTAPSNVGFRVAEALAQIAVRNNWVVVSGHVVGIDLAAHLGALDGEGKTIGVVADILQYPDLHYFHPPMLYVDKGIFTYGGCLVTEHGEKPASPPEDRIMARDRI